MDKKVNPTVSIKEENGVTIAIITESVPQPPIMKTREVSYDTIVSHIQKIDDSIAALQAEKAEYEILLGLADTEIAKVPKP